VMLLGRPYEPTAKLGFLLARKRWDPTHPNRELLLALARCSHQAARTQAFTWIDEQRMQLLSEGAFLASLVAAPFEDTRAFARRFLRSATLAVPVARALMGRLVAELVALGPGAEALANDVVQTVLTTLSAHLAGVGVSIIRDLLAHPLGAVQELGAELLLRHDARSGIIPEEILMGILRSPHPNVRAVGMRLIGELDDDTLIAMDPLLLHLSTDANADIRNAVRPVVKRVVASHPEVGVGIATGLVESLLRRRLAEDVPSHVLRVLKEDLSRSLARLSREMVWQLLQSASPHAQELGGILLPSHLDASAMEIDQIVRLASHEILSVRMASWAMCERIVPRLAADMPSAVRILDAKWADSRAWAFEFFRIKMPDSAFSAQAIITIVDSVREDVQAFGRELLQKHFKEEDGPELLRKLSEHPGRSVQLFGTNYLDRYAGGHVDEIERLSPYFTSVLSRVNQGRVAKSRVLAFLRREGLRTEECARLVMGLLHRLSATIAIEDRGTAIETMTALHRAWPAVPVPLRVKPVEVRKAKGAA